MSNVEPQGRSQTSEPNEKDGQGAVALHHATSSPLGRDADWVLAMGEALGMNSGYSVPIVPTPEAFRRLFDAVRAGHPAPSEPVAWRYRYASSGGWFLATEPAAQWAADVVGFEEEPLYATPQVHPAQTAPTQAPSQEAQPSLRDAFAAFLRQKGYTEEQAKAEAAANFGLPAQPAPAPVDARKLAWELAGVLEDVKRDGFDDVCRRTVERVHAALVAQEVHPVPRQLHEWAALQDESDGSPWSEGYEAARRYVAMQISQQPNGGATAAPCEFCEANKKLADIALRAAERHQRMGHLAELHGSAPAALEADERSLDARDAARYRWLRSEHEVQNPLAAVCWKRNADRTESDWVNTVNAEFLDRAIDAAMGAAPTGVPQDSEPTSGG
jgi:hypothetical protein